MQATGAELSMLLQSAPLLNDFSFMVDNTLRIAWTEIIQHGSIPYMQWSEIEPGFPLDCRAGEPCGFILKLTLGIQYQPLRSIGVNFELRMDPIPQSLSDHTTQLRTHIYGNGTGTAQERNTNDTRTTHARRTHNNKS